MDDDNITYLIMTNSIYPKPTAIGCLDSIKKELNLILKTKNLSSIREYGLNSELNEKLKMKYEYFNKNTNVSSDTIGKLKQELTKMKEAVYDANEKLLIRGEKIDIMENKAIHLEGTAREYKQGAIKVRKSVSGRRICLYAGIIVLLLVIVYIIISLVCKSWVFKCGSNN